MTTKRISYCPFCNLKFTWDSSEKLGDLKIESVVNDHIKTKHITEQGWKKEQGVRK